MLDLITLVSTMGLQDELSKVNQDKNESLVIKKADSTEDSLVQQAADGLDAAMSSIESAFSGLFSGGEPAPATESKQLTSKKPSWP
mmetsp:Transcript_7907/g.11143  ORF Transcript_7907/g.11143 Transcript_7907/m.11143 type:complete len:86 (-) Transcript_7907:151-408(-)